MNQALHVAIAAAQMASVQYTKSELPDGSIVVIEIRSVDGYKIIDSSSCQIGRD